MLDACLYLLCGDLDLESAPRTREDLRLVVSGSNSDVVIDCADLTFIDSTGVALLLEAERDLKQRGRRMLIANASPGLRRTFEALGLADMLRSDWAPWTVSESEESESEENA